MHNTHEQPFLWSISDLADAIYDGLYQAAKDDDLAQEVYSIDALDELGLHPLIQRALEGGGFGVYPEQRYPADRIGRQSKNKAKGKRCDIVLTPDLRPLSEPDAVETLFAPADAVPLEQAFWLEIKTVSQYTTEGPFARYSAELLQPVSKDIRKMASDANLHHAALLLVLFTETESIAKHDLIAWQDKCLQKGYPVAIPTTRGFNLNNRLGNGYATIAIFPVRRL